MPTFHTTRNAPLRPYRVNILADEYPTSLLAPAFAIPMCQKLLGHTPDSYDAPSTDIETYRLTLHVPNFSYYYHHKNTFNLDELDRNGDYTGITLRGKTFTDGNHFYLEIKHPRTRDTGVVCYTLPMQIHSMGIQKGDQICK